MIQQNIGNQHLSPVVDFQFTNNDTLPSPFDTAQQNDQLHVIFNLI